MDPLLRGCCVIFRSPHPDITVPDIALHRFVLARAAQLGSKPALIDGPSGRMLTYGQLGAGVDGVAAGLVKRGFEAGDVLGLFMPNCPEFALVFHGTLAAAGVVTTVNSLCTVQDAAYQLRDARARFLVTVPQFMDRPRPRRNRWGSRKSSFWAVRLAPRRSRRCSRPALLLRGLRSNPPGTSRCCRTRAA